MTTVPEPEGNRDVEELLSRIGAEFSSAGFEPPPIPGRANQQPIRSEGQYLVELQQLHLKSLSDDIEARRTYGRRGFKLMAVWLALVLATVWASAVKFRVPQWYPEWLPLCQRFQLSDSVLLALIGSTTANIIGLLVIMFNYLFPNRK